MKHYIGTDIIEIDRIRSSLERWGERFLQRAYTTAEIELYRQRPPSLAAAFAGKEAVMKVLGTGARGVAWREIEILSRPGGKPCVTLRSRAKEAAENLGIIEMDISLSHSREYAVAVAIGTA